MRRDHSRYQAGVTRRDYLFGAGSIAALSGIAGCLGLGDDGQEDEETENNDSEDEREDEDESESPDTEDDEGDEDEAAEGLQEGPGDEIGSNESSDDATANDSDDGTTAEDDEDELDDPPLTVVVEDVEGNPVSEGVTVNANIEDGEVSYVLTDFEEGSATVQNAAPGEYTVVAEHDEYGTVEESVTVEGEDVEVTLAFDEDDDGDDNEDDKEDNQSEEDFGVEDDDGNGDEDDEDGRFEQYRIEDLSYQVDHPADWEIEEGDDYVQIQNDDETAWIWIEVREARDDLDREVQRFREDADPNPGVEIHEDDPVTLSSGEDGHRFVIEMTERERDMFAHELIAQANGYHYRTAVVVLQSEYNEEYAQLAEEILSTVALL